jgi:hypothetical protein
LERQIHLEGIDPLEFTDQQHEKNLIKKLFPKINIAARGQSLFIRAKRKEIVSFEKKFTFC